MLKMLLYPFFTVQSAIYLSAHELQLSVKNRLRQAVNETIAETISDAREINELKAEIAVLRSEINEIKYGGNRSGVNVL